MDPELAKMIHEADDAARLRANAWERLQAQPGDDQRRIEYETLRRIEFERGEAVKELRARLEGRPPKA